MKTIKTINHTKNLISLALFQLMLKHEYNDITVKDICNKAGVSRMSFYRYYNKKDDIFVDFCDARFEEFYMEYLNHRELTLEEFTISTFYFFKKYARQLGVLKKAGKEQILIEQFNGYAKFLMIHSSSKSVQQLFYNPVVAPFLAGGLFNLLMSWLNTGMEKSPEEMCESLLSIPTLLSETDMRK